MQRQSAPVTAAPTITDAGIAFGNPAAQIVVVEYTSPSCSHCADFDFDVYPEFKAKYVDSGLARFELREYLTSPRAYAAAIFAIARCAGPLKYMTVVEASFRNQTELFATQDTRESLLSAARSGGLDEDQAQKCISDPRFLKAMNERQDRASTVDHVDGTPTIFVNGRLINGNSMGDLENAILSSAK